MCLLLLVLASSQCPDEAGPRGCKSLLCSWHGGTGSAAAAAALPDGAEAGAAFRNTGGARDSLGGSQRLPGLSERWAVLVPSQPRCPLSPLSPACSSPCPALWCPLQPPGRAGVPAGGAEHGRQYKWGILPETAVFLRLTLVRLTSHAAPPRPESRPAREAVVLPQM